MDDLEFQSRFDQSGVLNEIDESESSTPRSAMVFAIPEVGAPEEEEEKTDTKSAGQKKKEAESPKFDLAQAQAQNMMIIGLSGPVAGASVTGRRAEESESDEGDGDGDDINISEAEKRELLKFLQESINEYAKYIRNIGRNGLAAVNLNYYRDDIQELMDYMKYDNKVSLKEYWGQVVKLDIQLRGRAQQHVREVGYENFKQYQIINDPPAANWWWYLNRLVMPPSVQGPKFWELWK